MNALQSLIERAGEWRGTSVLRDPQSGRPEASESRLVITPVAGGRFVRIDYEWAYRSQRQDGSLLLGLEAQSGTVNGHWIDSWHMGAQAMACSGTINNGAVSITGSYDVRGSEPWRWRIELRPAGDALDLRMFNLAPSGEEAPAVEAAYKALPVAARRWLRVLAVLIAGGALSWLSRDVSAIAADERMLGNLAAFAGLVAALLLWRADRFAALVTGVWALSASSRLVYRIGTAADPAWQDAVLILPLLFVVFVVYRTLSAPRLPARLAAPAQLQAQAGA